MQRAQQARLQQLSQQRQALEQRTASLGGQLAEARGALQALHSQQEARRGLLQAAQVALRASWAQVLSAESPTTLRYHELTLRWDTIGDCDA